MALAELLSALRSQGAERRAAELADADAQASRITAEASASLERRRKEFVADARRSEEEVAHRSLARAEVEAAQSVLSARDALLARVRSALQLRIAAAEDDSAYPDVLAHELDASLARLPPGGVVVRARPASAALLEGSLRGRQGIASESVPEMGAGFCALVPEAGVEIDATLEARLEHAWPALAVEVLTELDS